MKDQEKKYVYHLAPKEFFGTTLLPLNVLKTEYPHVYTQAAKKYEGRESLREQWIPPLNCKWSDLVMFSFTPPEIIVAEYRALGKKTRSPIEYYRVDISTLDRSKFTVFTNERDFSPDESFIDSDFIEYDSSLHSSLSEFREVTREYYRTLERPLLFWRLAHLLYKGGVPRSLLDVCHLD